jgi:hypothetical protein
MDLRTVPHIGSQIRPRGSGFHILAAAAAAEFKLPGQNRLEGDDSDFNATPAIAGRQIFLRSSHNLYCIALPTGLCASR